MLCSVIIVKTQKVHQTGHLKSVQYHVTPNTSFYLKKKFGNNTLNVSNSSAHNIGYMKSLKSKDALTV